MNPNRNPKTPLAVVLATCLLLAACGSSDDSTADVVDTAATDTAAETSTSADADSATTTSAEGETSDATLASDYLASYSLMDEEYGTMVTVTVADGTRTIVSNALPDHETGEFPNDGNPNTITEQDITYEITTEPTYVGDAGFSLTTGVAVNGVKFEPGTGESVTCETGESYRVEAINSTHDLGLDFNNAHVQPDGEYHYHGISELLVEAYQNDVDLVHVGFANDGFLMYYSKSGAYTSSYALDPNGRTGTDCLATGPDGETFDLEGTAPDGSYNTDWVFSDGSGDLDSCNGVEIDGQYAYIVTDTYPYVSRCLNGEVAGGGGEGGGEGAGGGAPEPPDLAAISEALGVTQDELEAALGSPPYDVDAAAEALGVAVEELEALLPDAPA